MYDLVLIAPKSDFLEDEFVIPNITLIMMKSWLMHWLDNKSKIKVMIMAEYDNKYSEIPEAKYYGISFTTPHVYEVKQLYKFIKEKYPNSKIIGGGPHPTALPYYSISNKLCDEVIQGPGEKSLLNILNNSFEFKKYIPEDDDKYNDNYEMYELESYKEVRLDYSDIDVKRYKSWLLVTDIGCPYTCSFCFKLYKHIQYFPEDFIFNCIEDYVNLGLDSSLKLTSDNVLINYWKRSYWIFNLLKGFNIKFEIVGRLDHIEKDIIEHLKECGCTIIKVGMESGSQTILNLMNKRITLEKMKKGFDILHEVGLDYGLYLIVDFPGETKKDLYNTISFIKNNLKPKFVGCYTHTPYPGSPDWLNGVSLFDKEKFKKQNFRGFLHAEKIKDRTTNQKLVYKNI